MNDKHIYNFTHMHIPACVNRVEQWLKGKSLEGYQLVKMRGWKFCFKKSKACEREYFIYRNFDNGKGIDHDFLMAKRKYGIKNPYCGKIPLNFFEADPLKTDNEYLRTKKLRNSYYQKHYLGLSIFLAVLLLISIYLTFYEMTVIMILLLIVPMFLYSLISLLIITNYLRHNK